MTRGDLTQRTTPGLGGRFGTMWVASTVANVADGIAQTAVPLLAAALTRDPTLVAGTLVAQRLPTLLFALPVGAYLDRIDRKQAMAVAGGLRAGVTALLALAVTAWSTGASGILLPLLYLAAFLLGTAETVYDTAARTIVPALVPQTLLVRANGRLFGAQTVAQYFAGPPLGGLLFAVAAAVPFVVNGAAYALAAVVVLAIPGAFRVAATEPRPGTRPPLRAEIMTGLRWLWHDRLMRAFAVATAVLAMSGAAMSAVLVLYAQRTLGLGTVGFGLLLAAGAVGSFLGSASAAWLSRRTGPGVAVLISVLGAALTCAGMALTTNPVVAAMWYCANGWTVLVWNVVSVSVRQALIPDRLLGRVLSANLLVAGGAVPLGAALGGLLARVDVRGPMLAAAVTFVLLTAYVSTSISNRRIAESSAREPSSTTSEAP